MKKLYLFLSLFILLLTSCGRITYKTTNTITKLYDDKEIVIKIPKSKVTDGAMPRKDIYTKLSENGFINEFEELNNIKLTKFNVKNNVYGDIHNVYYFYLENIEIPYLIQIYDNGNELHSNINLMCAYVDIYDGSIIFPLNYANNTNIFGDLMNASTTHYTLDKNDFNYLIDFLENFYEITITDNTYSFKCKINNYKDFKINVQISDNKLIYYFK